jgi:hypothetical protein
MKYNASKLTVHNAFLSFGRDRVNTIWQVVRDHIYSLVMGAAACDNHFLMERSIVGLLRLAIRLMRREDMTPVVSCIELSKPSELDSKQEWEETCLTVCL